MEQIPHILHYCWFGGNPKPDIVRQCMESWSKYFFGWEIREWNENNFDVHKTVYSSEAYKAKKYAFVADYARFDILYRCGGVYVDTDVEFIKPLPNKIIENHAFSGMESNNKVNPGLIFGAVKSHPFVGEMLNLYLHKHFEGVNDGTKTVVDYTTGLLSKHGYKENGEYQFIYDVALYPSFYFCGYNLDIHEMNICPETISVHHYAASWSSGKSKTKRRFLQLLKKVVGIKSYTKLLMCKRRVKGKVDMKKIMRYLLNRVRGEVNLSKLEKDGIKIGKNFSFGRDTFIDPSHCFLIIIGDNVTFSTRVHVLAHDASMYKILGYTKIALTRIEDDVFVGANTTILPGVTIGKNSIVAAGSVVTKSIPQNEVWAGVPACFISTLDDFRLKYQTLLNDESIPKYGDEFTVRKGVDFEKKKNMIQTLEKSKIGLIE